MEGFTSLFSGALIIKWKKYKCPSVSSEMRNYTELGLHTFRSTGEIFVKMLLQRMHDCERNALCLYTD